MAAYVPCLLCGKIHELSIHVCLLRKLRVPEKTKNIEITIIAIICRRAKKQGKQYTKRILPPFVIPYCVISRESVLAYVRKISGGTLNSDEASKMMGTVDLRAISRHRQKALTEIKKAALLLSQVLSEIPPYGRLPPRKVEETEVEHLDKAAEEMNRASERVLGGSAEKIPPIVYVHAVSVYARARKPLKTPLTLVLKAAVFHDTS